MPGRRLIQVPASIKSGQMNPYIKSTLQSTFNWRLLPAFTVSLILASYHHHGWIWLTQFIPVFFGILFALQAVYNLIRWRLGKPPHRWW